MTGLPDVGSTVRWGRVRYEVVGHYCGGHGTGCLHGGRAVAAVIIRADGSRMYELGKSGQHLTVCLDAAKVTLEAAPGGG